MALTNLSPMLTISMPLSASAAFRTWINSVFVNGVWVFKTTGAAARLAGRMIVRPTKSAYVTSTLFKSADVQLMVPAGNTSSSCAGAAWAGGGASGDAAVGPGVCGATCVLGTAGVVGGNPGSLGVATGTLVAVAVTLVAPIKLVVPAIKLVWPPAARTSMRRKASLRLVAPAVPGVGGNGC